MENRKGFTLAELIVVIIIVSILATVVIAVTKGRIDSAKWTEGKSMAGSIATAIRTYAVEKNSAGNYGADAPTLAQMNFKVSDLTGTYFSASEYSWTTAYDPDNDPPLTFTITVDAPDGISFPEQVTLNENGEYSG